MSAVRRVPPPATTEGLYINDKGGEIDTDNAGDSGQYGIVPASEYSMNFFFFQAEDGIRDDLVTGVQTCALPIYRCSAAAARPPGRPSAPTQALAAHVRPIRRLQAIFAGELIRCDNGYDLRRRSSSMKRNTATAAFTPAAIPIRMVNHASGSASSKRRVSVIAPWCSTKKNTVSANRAAGCSVSSRAPIDDAK